MSGWEGTLVGAENIFNPSMARIWLAPVGTIAPDGPNVVMPAGWYDAGQFTPDSLNYKSDPKFEDVKAHQSNYTVRKLHTEDSADLEADLLEWTLKSFQAVFGGGTIEEVTPAVGAHYYKFVPPEIGGRVEVSACVELSDGARKMRRIIPRCMQTSGVEQKLEKVSASTLPLRMSVLGSDIGPASYDVFNLAFASFAPPA